MKSCRHWVWMLTLWFALLQTIAPLMHAHASGDTAADDGPHMHMVDIPALHAESTSSQHTFHWHMHADKSHGQIIGLSPGINEQSSLQALIDAGASLWAIALLPALLLLLAPLPALRPRRPRQKSRWLHGTLTYLSPSPRAPPRA